MYLGRQDTRLRKNILLLLFLLAYSQIIYAQIFGSSFWKRRVSSLNITTGAQSIYTSNCSGVVTVQTRNANNTATNVASNLTVSLVNTGATFYSDPNCITAIASATVTVLSGTNSVNFYFIGSTLGTNNLTASATGYVSVTQAETIATNPFIWTGGGANAFWSTAGNWSGGVAPGSGNIALFNGVCVTNCSPSINANMSISGVRLTSAYAGTITQNAGVTITVGANGWSQLGGIFLGGDSTITLNGHYALVGGSFTSTSTNLISGNNCNITIGSGVTFIHNSGKIFFNTYKAVSIDSSIYLNDLDITNGANGPYLNSAIPLNIDGNLTIGYTAFNGSFSGIFNVKKDVIFTGNSSIFYSGFRLNLIGTGVQNLTGNVAGYNLPILTIASTGTVNFNTTGTPYFFGNFTYTSGTVNFVNPSIGLKYDSGATNIISAGSLHLPSVDMGGGNGGGFTITGSLYIDGNLSLTNQGCGACGGISGGTIELMGNLTNTSDIGAVSSTLNLNGTTQQSISVTNPVGNQFGRINVNNAAGAILTTSFNASIQYLSLVSGPLNMNGLNLTVWKPSNTGTLLLNGNTLTKNAGVLTVNSSVVGTGSLFGGTISP